MPILIKHPSFHVHALYIMGVSKIAYARKIKTCSDCIFFLDIFGLSGTLIGSFHLHSCYAIIVNLKFLMMLLLLVRYAS